MSDRDYWNSYARSTLTLDGRTGADVRWEPYTATSLGQKVRGWLRFAHTGELGGSPAKPSPAPRRPAEGSSSIPASPSPCAASRVARQAPRGLDAARNGDRRVA